MAAMTAFHLQQLTLTSGKGGVGKTTVSCAIALTHAETHPSDTVLLLSTDPAHSLGDVLQLSVDDTARSHPEVTNLQVRALDAERLLQDFKARYGQVLETLVERGSFVENEDLSPVWDMEWPGLNELMGLLEIQRILRAGEADRVVVDMAPSGHTLNLFGLMDFLDRLLDSLRLFQEKHRYLIKTFSGHYTPDEADDFLETMTTDLAEGRAQLQDPARAACWVVGIPEPLSVRETERFVTALEKLGIPLGGIVVNRLSDSLAQAQNLAQFRAIAPEQTMLGLPLQPQEPVGRSALLRLLQGIAPLEQWMTASGDRADSAVVWPSPIPPGFHDFIAEGRRLVLVGGKGGVGKTTVAAATGWGLAQRHPEAAVRVISVDPAHSLGDAFETCLGHTPTQLSDNLSAQEVDADTVLEQFREDYLWELAEMMSGDRGDGPLQLAYGPEAWRQIVAQALPGIDEMLSLIAVMDHLEQHPDALIVLDTAPTGHLLRFLEMPTALGDWLAWIFKLWIKYQDVVGRVELMGRLRTLRKRVMTTQKRLKDANHTEFVGVVQNQSAILAEAARLTQTLSNMGLSQQFVVHNRYQSGQDLPAKQFPEHTIVRLPVLPEREPPQAQIRGAAELLFIDA